MESFFFNHFDAKMIVVECSLKRVVEDSFEMFSQEMLTDRCQVFSEEMLKTDNFEMFSGETLKTDGCQVFSQEMLLTDSCQVLSEEMFENHPH